MIKFIQTCLSFWGGAAIFFALIFCITRNTLPYTKCKYLPTKDEVQQMINERLPLGCRVRVDGNIQTETNDAWDFVLIKEHTVAELIIARRRWMLPKLELNKIKE